MNKLDSKYNTASVRGYAFPEVTHGGSMRIRKLANQLALTPGWHLSPRGQSSALVPNISPLKAARFKPTSSSIHELSSLQ